MGEPYAVRAALWKRNPEILIAIYSGEKKSWNWFHLSTVDRMIPQSDCSKLGNLHCTFSTLEPWNPVVHLSVTNRWWALACANRGILRVLVRQNPSGSLSPHTQSIFQQKASPNCNSGQICNSVNIEDSGWFGVIFSWIFMFFLNENNKNVFD